MLIVYNLTRYGKNAPLGDDLEELLGRPPTTMRQFIRDYQDRWAPNASETDATKIVRTPGLGLR
jgi:hypothetical protein